MLAKTKYEGTFVTVQTDQAAALGGVKSSDDDTQVVSIFQYSENLRYPILDDLETYWEHLRGDRLLPDRSDINPRDIQDSLEYAFIAERIAPGIARLRLAGMHMNELLGMEVRGMPLTAFFDPSHRRLLGDALDAVFEGPEVVTLTLASAREVGKPELDAKLLLMPLRSDFGDVTRVLGALQSHGPVGRAPRRFTVTQVEKRALDAKMSTQAQPQSQDTSRIASLKAAVGEDARVIERGHLKLLNFDN